MDTAIELGSVTFQSSDTNLSLLMEASMLMQPHGRIPGAARHWALKHWIETGMVWVAEGPETRLNMQISAHSASNITVSTLVRVIGEMLCNSKLWVDLGLVLTFKSCDYLGHNDPPVFQLIFGLKRSLRQPAALSTVNRRVPTAVQAHGNLIPPLHVETIRMSSIDIKLYFEPRCSEVQPYTLVFPMTEKRGDEYEVFGIESEGFRGEPVHRYELLGDWGVYEAPDTKSFKEELADMDDSDDSTILTSPPLEKAWEAHDTHQQALHYLFNTGMSSLFIDDSSEERRKELDLENGQMQSLSRMAPLLFNPGYSTAMSQRSALIPSLVKSITSILNLPVNRSVPQNVDSLKAAYIPGDFPPTAVDTGDVLKAAFWTLAQKQLYRAEASRKLSLLESALSMPVETHVYESLLAPGSVKGPPHWFGHTAEKIDMTSDYYLGSGDGFDINSESPVDSLLSVDDECVCSVTDNLCGSFDGIQAAAMGPFGLDPCSGVSGSGSQELMAEMCTTADYDDMMF